MRWLGLIIISIALAAFGNTAWAASAKGKPTTEWVTPTHIQMIPMMVPAGRQTVPMTFFLEATKQKKVEDICKRMPRVRDALIRNLSRKPIPVKNRRLILKGLDKRILKPINKAVGHKYVQKVFIAKGAVRMGTGKIEYRPFAVIGGCTDILRSELEREQAARAAKK